MVAQVSGYYTITSTLPKGKYKAYCVGASVSNSYYDVSCGYYDYNFVVSGGTYKTIDTSSLYKVYEFEIISDSGSCSFTTSKWSNRINCVGIMLVFKN